MNENMEKNQNINNQEPKNENKRNTFNIIIGVSTLLIAILGATFAYFSATATSKDNDVNVKSAYVSISYDGGTEIKASNLIPASERIALKMFQKENIESIGAEGDENLEIVDEDLYTNDTSRRCIDVRGREVCYVYQFTITSDGEVGGTTGITGYIKVNQNQFDNLSYVIYEVTFKKNETGKILLDKYGHKIVEEYKVVDGINFPNVDNNADHDEGDPNFSSFEKPTDVRGDNGEYQSTKYPLACLFGYSDSYATAEADDPARCRTAQISNKESHTYQVMVWLNETGKVQDEQGKTFQGTVSIEVPGGTGGSDYEDGKITGKQ